MFSLPPSYNLIDAGVRWKRMPESQFPLLTEASHSSAAVPTAVDEERDLVAALDAAGGGKGVNIDDSSLM